MAVLAPHTAPVLPLLVILGPTASGKTHLAVQVADALGCEIISADSRQVYRNMNIGTGKDLVEYTLGHTSIPYHLIDIVDAGEKYNVHRFQHDFSEAYMAICQRGNVPLVCGGSGLYLDAILRSHTFTSVPVDADMRADLENMPSEELMTLFTSMDTIYTSLADVSTRKRLIRAIEISAFLKANPDFEPEQVAVPPSICFGLNPSLHVRRERITRRLADRLENGLVEEIRELIDGGVTPDQLVYYGLEYKYVTQYITGGLSLAEMKSRLETEIHRFAKRQMTFFRKMEKDNIPVDWLDPQKTIAEHVAYIISKYNDFSETWQSENQI